MNLKRLLILCMALAIALPLLLLRAEKKGLRGADRAEGHAAAEAGAGSRHRRVRPAARGRPRSPRRRSGAVAARRRRSQPGKIRRHGRGRRAAFRRRYRAGRALPGKPEGFPGQAGRHGIEQGVFLLPGRELRVLFEFARRKSRSPATTSRCCTARCASRRSTPTPFTAPQATW